MLDIKYELMLDRDEFTIKFALWLREVDTAERAEEWFGFTNEDMLQYFKENIYG